MKDSFKDLINLLEMYESNILCSDESFDIEIFNKEFQYYFENECSDDDKLPHAKIIIERLKKLNELINAEIQKINQSSKDKQDSWNIQKKYLEILKL